MQGLNITGYKSLEEAIKHAPVSNRGAGKWNAVKSEILKVIKIGDFVTLGQVKESVYRTYKKLFDEAGSQHKPKAKTGKSICAYVCYGILHSKNFDEVEKNGSRVYKRINGGTTAEEEAE